MKTLAVLSAFVTIAIAAPSAEEFTLSSRLSPKDFVITQQREKKSTTHGSLPDKLPDHLEDHTVEQNVNNGGPSNTVARTFSGMKKPFIVKKKIGYQLYRDLEDKQSQVNSEENCRKHITVKLCEDNNAMEKMSSASPDHSHENISETEMEHSINIAKEAVQTFERDLHKMELECAENNKHSHTHVGSDTELHSDIEKARQALEHIHKKFKNLESTATTTGESKLKLNLQTVKSDEERLAQWKEAGNLRKNVEIARNLEDNFKFTDGNDESKHIKFHEDATKEFKATIEDIDTMSNTNNKVGDGITTIVEDKKPQMDIQSDNLIKDNTANHGGHQNEELCKNEGHAHRQKEMTEKNAELNNHEIINNNQGQETNEQVNEDKDIKSKFVEMKGTDLNTLEKHTGGNVDNIQIMKSSEDSFASDNHAQAKLKKELHIENLHTKLRHENDQATHESQYVDTILNTNNNKSTRSEEVEMVHEAITSQHDQNKAHVDHENIENTKFLAKDTGLKSISHNQENLRNDDNKAAHFRATSDFHKEILNNMDFIEDSHHTILHHPTETRHKMNNEKPELQERLNVPVVQPSSEHFKTMMHFSDNAHHENSHLKMSSMFDNEEPNFNVQFNSPQDFEEQTNVQELMPFKSTSEFHHDTGLDERLKNIHDKDDVPTELHDSLKIRWSHPENMRMDGSSQHFNVEKPISAMGSLINDQHLMSLNEQIRAQQRWAQAKSLNTHQLSPINTGFEHLHTHDTFTPRINDHNMMLLEKSNRDNHLHPSVFTQMRSVPKMDLENTNSKQWTHNHDAFRSSYGPSMSASYGSSSGGSPMGIYSNANAASSSGGSAVGVFPNANVGNCAVPLLLSCSPSVVSGSLAKTQNAYSAPSYRSEDINFLKKRGVDIDDVTLGQKLHRHTSMGHRSNMILEKNNNTV